MEEPPAVPVPPRPLDEGERLAALYRSRALGVECEAAFDDLVELAALITGLPISSLNFIDEGEQVSVAAHGVQREALGLPRDEAVCSYTILEAVALEIEDLAVDPRTSANATLQRFGLRHYTGAAIRTREGHALGALCVLGPEPLTLNPAQVAGLEALARQAAILLEWRNSRVAGRSTARRSRASA